VFDAVTPDRGPVTVDSDVDPDHVDAFVTGMLEVRQEGRRHGAVGWALQQDAAAPHLWLGTFRPGSWLEHKRQNARVSHAEVDAQARADTSSQGRGAARAPPSRPRADIGRRQCLDV
jgi:hypothetical protein